MLTDGHPSGSVTRLRELQQKYQHWTGELYYMETRDLAREIICDLNELAAALAPAVVPKCVHGIECPWWHQPWMEANSKPASPPVVAPVAAPVQWTHAMMQEFVNEVQQHLSAGRTRAAALMFEKSSPSLPLTGGRAGLEEKNMAPLAGYAFNAVRELARQMGGTLTPGGNLLSYHPHVGAICDWMDQIEAEFQRLRDTLTRPQGGESDGK